MAHIKYATGTGTGNWVTISNGTAIKVATGTGTGSWVNPTKIYVATGTGTGSWSQVWAKSDPVTLAFTCNVSGAWRDNLWRTGDDIYFGAWQDGAPYGTLGSFFGDNLSVLEFSGNSTTGGYTSTSLQEALAVRPNVTSATLYLYRTTAGFGPTISMTNTLKVGQMNKNNGTTLNYDSADFVQTTNMQTIPSSDVIGWNHNAAKTFDLPSSGLTDFITHVSTKQLWISEKSSGWVPNGGSSTWNKLYSTCNGASDSNPPVLTVTIDY